MSREPSSWGNGRGERRRTRRARVGIRERVNGKRETWNPRGGETVVPANVVDISDLRADRVPPPAEVLDDPIRRSPLGPKIYRLVDRIAWDRANGKNVSSLEAELRSTLGQVGRHSGDTPEPF